MFAIVGTSTYWCPLSMLYQTKYSIFANVCLIFELLLSEFFCHHGGHLGFHWWARHIDIRNGVSYHWKHHSHKHREDNSYRSQNMAISAILYILAAILDSGDRIAKPTSIMVLQPLINHRKWYRGLSSPSRLKVKYFSRHFGGHLGF